MKLPVNAKNYRWNSCVKLISLLTCASLCGCNGGENSTAASAQSEAVNLFNQRNAIILDAIKNGKQVVLPSSLKTYQELRVASIGAYGSNLGMPGYNKMNAMFSHDSCIITKGDFFSNSNYAKGPKSDTVLFTSVSTTKSAAQSQAVSASLAAGVSLVKVSGSAVIENSSTFNDSEIGFDVIMSINGIHQLNDDNISNSGALRDFFKPAYITKGSVNDSFYKSCGDGYVYSEEYTAGVKGHVTIKLQNQDDASKFSASLATSYGSFAELSAAVEAASKKTNQKAEIVVALSQLGGDSGGLLKIVNTDVLTCSAANFDSCNATMKKVLEYGSTFADQVQDPATKNVKPDKVSYLNPSFTKYENKVKLNQVDSPEGQAAIARLNKIYLDNIKLYYAFQEIIGKLDGSAQNELRKAVINKLGGREEYISAQAPLCYNEPARCGSEILPLIINQINKSFPIDPDVLDFYARRYQADNFLNLNVKFGSSTELAAIKAKLIPMSTYISGGETKFNYAVTNLGDCKTTMCNNLQAKVKAYKVENDDLMHYKITFDNITPLVYECRDNRSNGSLDCHGYYGADKAKIFDKNDTSSFDWSDSLYYKYMAGFTDEGLRQIAKPTI